MTDDELRDELDTTARNLATLREQVSRLLNHRDGLIVEARQRRWTTSEIGAWADVDRTFVSKLAPTRPYRGQAVAA